MKKDRINICLMGFRVKIWIDDDENKNNFVGREPWDLVVGGRSKVGHMKIIAFRGLQNNSLTSNNGSLRLNCLSHAQQKPQANKITQSNRKQRDISHQEIRCFVT